MIINKKLIHFNHKEDFEERNNAGDILDSSIVFVKDSHEIYTHGEQYQFIEWSYLTTDVPVGYSVFMLADGSQWVDCNGQIIFVKE